MRRPHCRLYNACTSGSPVSTIEYLLGDLFETNGSGTVTTSYTDDPAGDLASYQGLPDGSSTVSFQYYDAHGDLVAEADPSGSLTASHTYDPFGAPNDSTPANTTTHRFVGAWAKQYDNTSGLILMGARPYSSATGRFLSVDPVPGGSLNNYDYAGQDPVGNYDLSGTVEEEDGDQFASLAGSGEGSEQGGGRDSDERVPPTRGQARDQAKKLGFRLIKDVSFKTHDQQTFTGRLSGFGKVYISADRTVHTGRAWKVFDANGERIGTYTWNLGKRIRG